MYEFNHRQGDKMDKFVLRNSSGIELRTLGLRDPRFKSCAAVLKPWASVFTIHCSSSLSCINQYLAVEDMCTSSLRALIVAYGWMLPREAEMVSE